VQRAQEFLFKFKPVSADLIQMLTIDNDVQPVVNTKSFLTVTAKSSKMNWRFCMLKFSLIVEINDVLRIQFC